MAQYLSPGVYVEEVPSAIKAIAGVGTSTPGFIGAITNNKIHLVARDPKTDPSDTNPTPYKLVEFEIQAPVNEPKLITSWTQFTRLFGDLVGDETATAASGSDLDIDSGHRNLAHAVYGFFNNGGSSCYVMWIESAGADYSAALHKFDAIDDVSLIAIPGVTDSTAYKAVIDHCENFKDRFGILDGPSEADISQLVPATPSVADSTTQPDTRSGTPYGAPSGRRSSTALGADGVDIPGRTTFAAWYFPCIKVFDPGEKLRHPKDDGTITVPPSGHIAGVYARVDGERGVHKAPANEVIRGALGVTQAISKPDQDKLNPSGVNCIRLLNGNIYVWGARTVGGEINADLKYINVRRTLLFIQESIDQGTQWVVFEPNTPALWQKIIRNVTAFLTEVWRAGALFGTTPQEAFFVRCDAELNPPDQRELGQVVTEIGVAIVRPAEFVIFRISQFSAPGK